MFYQNVSELFTLNARRYPQKEAIVFGSTRVTYDELNRLVNRTANALLQLGAGIGSHIAFMLPNCVQLVQIYYAIQKIGAVAIPIDYKLTQREINLLASHGDVSMLISGKPLDDSLSCTLIAMEAFAKLTEGASEEEPLTLQDPGALSRIQFTGGSTGLPKGVMRTHQADLTEIVGEMIYNKIGADINQVVLVQCPLAHHGGHSWYTATLSSGGTLVICDIFSPQEIFRLIEEEGVTYMLLLPPTTYMRLCDSPLLKQYNVSSVKLIQSAAGGITPEIVKRITEAFPACEIYYGWGQTESGLGTSIVLTKQMAEENHPLMGSIGRAMPFLEMRIIDEEGNELPPGEAGELAVKSPAIMAGYYGQPEASAQVLIKDGWLRTGDIMRIDSEGYAYMLSRKKDMIKTGGENVFAKEVEDVIMLHPFIAQAVVIGVDDPVFGEAVLAIVQLKHGFNITLEELQGHCKLYIASYKKPRYLEIVDAFDFKNDAGKIDKPALRKKYKLRGSENSGF